MKRLPMMATMIAILLSPVLALAANDPIENLHLTSSTPGIIALCFFIFAYILVMSEEFIHLRKSKPVVISAGIIWTLVAWSANQQGAGPVAPIIRHNLVEYAELFLFLLVAMTYIKALEERLVFEAVRVWLVGKNFSYRQLFWITGVLAFFISPIADNLTTALLMCAAVMAVGANNPRFVGIACVNIVVAANAGGAFSPFGDITTLMVWQKGVLHFSSFFNLFLPSVINFLVPAILMHFSIPKVHPQADNESVKIKFGGKRIALLFLLTILTTVLMHQFLHIPPVIGMMTGLGYLQIFSYYIKKMEHRQFVKSGVNLDEFHTFDIFKKVGLAEWDTLIFFYGVMLSVGGLATMGYLELVSTTLYQQWGANFSAIHTATPANIAVGFLSAIVDNIPVMFSVLTMMPQMSVGQWLLVTLTAGVGGSLLSIGSAAGVALMGQSKGRYTFFSHLRWTWAIALGYGASILVHFWINMPLFSEAVKLKY